MKWEFQRAHLKRTKHFAPILVQYLYHSIKKKIKSIKYKTIDCAIIYF